MTTELRCASKLHLVVVDEETVEITCNSTFCGKEPGVTVLHRFNVKTGKLINTRKFKNTNPRKVGVSNGS